MDFVVHGILRQMSLDEAREDERPQMPRTWPLATTWGLRALPLLAEPVHILSHHMNEFTVFINDVRTQSNIDHQSIKHIGMTTHRKKKEIYIRKIYNTFA